MIPLNLPDAPLRGWLQGSEMEVNEQFADRSVEWIQAADMESLQRWMHTVLRAERWRGEWPTAILDGSGAARSRRFCRGLRLRESEHPPGSTHASLR
jgi:hypothetical protein